MIELDLLDLPTEIPTPVGEMPERLYHYTDIHGLMGILESNSLWASAAYYLNDSSEIEYGCSLLLKELPHWVELNKGSKRFAARILAILYGVFSHPHSKLSRSSNIYVACFCEGDNLLSQWRAYSQKGGYALGFRARMDLSMKPAGPYNLSLGKVVYSEPWQFRRIRAVLREAILAVDAEFRDRPITDFDSNLVSDTVLMLQELLLDEIVRFKHPAFVDEREWRLVARFDPRRPLPKTKPSDQPLFRFRSSGGYLVPYIELKPAKGKLPLCSVRVGPSLDFKRYDGPTRLFLARHGFSDAEVVGSDLPVIL